jgi:hypothetical protein
MNPVGPSIFPKPFARPAHWAEGRISSRSLLLFQTFSKAFADRDNVSQSLQRLHSCLTGVICRIQTLFGKHATIQHTHPKSRHHHRILHTQKLPNQNNRTSIRVNCMGTKQASTVGCPCNSLRKRYFRSATNRIPQM